MPESKLVCPNCGFKAKHKGGLNLHMLRKKGCREALGKEYKSTKKVAEKPAQRPPEPTGGGEEPIDELGVLREIFINEGVERGRENIINSLKRGDIYDLYDLNEIMRERGIRPFKRRGVIRSWADASELDIPEELRKDLRMRRRRSRDYGVAAFGESSIRKKRARRVERLRERKYDRLEDLDLKREMKEQQKEIEAMEKGKEGKEKKSMMLVPLQQKDGSTTYQPVHVPKEYAAMSPMINPFMMSPAQFQKSDRGNEELRKRFEKGNEEARKRFEKLESMIEKMREDREHKAIRDEVGKLTERFERKDTNEDKGGALREELRDLRTKLDDERYKSLTDAVAHKLRDLDARTRHGDLDVYSKVSDKLENLGVSERGKKSREEHEMDIERTEHKKRLNMLENQYRAVHRRVDDIADVLKPAAKLLVMERVRKEGKKEGKRSLHKKYTPKELESLERALKKEDEAVKKPKRGKKKSNRE